MFNIRGMNELDIDSVYAIEKDVHIAPWERDILRDCVRVGYDCRVFECTVEGKLTILGYIICRHSSNCCHILNFCIAKTFQSQGYGSQLLHQVLDSISKLNYIDHALLEVRPSNLAALKLYKNLGFEQIAIKPAYYIENNHIEDALVLKKNF